MPQVSEEYLENRKKMIAKSALCVFSKKGYSNTSMKDIMNEADISRGGLYAHFKNIDAVFIAALMYDDALQANQLTILDLDKPILPQLNDWIYKTVQSVQDEKFNLVRAKSEFFLSHDIKSEPYLRKRYERLSETIKDLIDVGIKKGEFKKTTDKDSFCELLISMMDGVMLHQYYQYSSNFSLVDVLSLISKMIESYLT
ncbi:TetR/AcrR family transcriptional regulator [Enterococcus faecalis]|uniref:TetR/AcrR family transcriptional regulator n=1 Tax=Enterococcus faecalis TaxID=1351 RepID=UPI0035C9D0E2